MSKSRKPRATDKAGKQKPKRMPTLETVAQFDVNQWRDWWRDAIQSYAHNANPAAFEPFVLTGLTANAALDVAGSVERGLRQRSAVAARGLTLVLNDWQLLRDGAPGAALALGVAAQLSAPNLAQSICALLQKHQALALSERDRLALEMTTALIMRTHPSEALRAARAMRRHDLLTLGLAAQLIPFIAQGHAARLEVLVRELAPELVRCERTAPAVRIFKLSLGPAHRRPRASELPQLKPHQIDAPLRAFMEHVLARADEDLADTRHLIQDMQGKLEDSGYMEEFFRERGIPIN